MPANRMRAGAADLRLWAAALDPVQESWTDFTDDQISLYRPKHHDISTNRVINQIRRHDKTLIRVHSSPAAWRNADAAALRTQGLEKKEAKRVDISVVKYDQNIMHAWC